MPPKKKGGGKAKAQKDGILSLSYLLCCFCLYVSVGGCAMSSISNSITVVAVDQIIIL